jgi:hypothetical protein
MMKRKFLIFIGLAVIVLSAVVIYWVYFTNPASFPTNEQLMEEINHIFPEAEASVIQDTVPIDERHIVVPFVSKQDDYGITYWAWQKHNWQIVSIDTSGEPRLWKINKKDPSTFHLVWNIHPEDQLSYMRFYLIRDRGLQVSDGVETYNPRVQMEKKVSLEVKSYGVLSLPDEWVAIINPLIKIESRRQPTLFSNLIFSEREMFFGWTPYDKLNKESFPEGSINGSRSFNGDAHIDIDFVSILSEAEVESPLYPK